jgi:hypothetical protein
MAIEKHERGRTEKEKLTGVRAARWSGGELAVEDPISPGDIRKRSSSGGEEGEDVVRR